MHVDGLWLAVLRGEDAGSLGFAVCVLTLVVTWLTAVCDDEEGTNVSCYCTTCRIESGVVRLLTQSSGSRGLQIWEQRAGNMLSVSLYSQQQQRSVSGAVSLTRVLWNVVDAVALPGSASSGTVTTLEFVELSEVVSLLEALVSLVDRGSRGADGSDKSSGDESGDLHRVQL